MPGNTKRPERNPVLGVQFGHDQIRAVEMRRSGSELLITAAGSVSMPEGALDPGSHVSADILGQRLKTLVRKMGATTRHAVIGIPSSGVYTRLLDIPAIPDDELDAVVAGEVAHYQMVRQDGGAFGYAKIASPDGSREMPVIVMAADDPVLHFLDDIAKAAGLITDVKEPAQLGAIRASIPREMSEPTLFVSIEDTASEIAVIEDGRLALYRRIDVGGRHLMANALAAAKVSGEQTPPAFDHGQRLAMDEVLSARLATEIRRSLDFYRRQFPVNDVNQACLVVMDERLEPMSDYLGSALGVDCRIASTVATVSGTAAMETGAPIGVEWLSATGLALGELGYGQPTLPRFELTPSVTKSAKFVGGETRWMVSLAASILILAGGLFAWNSARADADRTQDEIVVLNRQNDDLMKQIAPRQQRRDMEYKVLAEFSKQGVPFPWIMDEVAMAMDPGVGLSEIRFDGGRLIVNGEAKNEAAMISTLDKLRLNGSFRATFVDQFQNDDGRGLRFNLSSRFVLVRPLDPAPSPDETAINTAPVAGQNGGTP